jgi:type I restriction enzyme, S subunit
MSGLLAKWTPARLGEVADWGSGGTPSRNNSAYFGGTIPWIKTGELGQGIINDTEEKITELGLKNSSAKIFRKGSVAIALYGATIGKTSILGIDAATNQACAVGFPINNIVGSKYLYYYLRSQKDAFVNSGQGGAQPNISQTIIKNWPIPLAPLPEQKRIADKLDSLLAKVDTCQAHLDRIPQILKRFRQAVLAAATSGRLTEEWREANSGGSPVWTEAAVGEVGEVFLGRQRSPENHHGPYMHKYVRAANITWRGWDFSDVKEMNFDPRDCKKYQLRVGDVLLNEGSGSADEVGKPAIWTGEIEDCCFQNTLICVRPREALSKYIYFVFLDAAMSRAFVKETRGVNIFHIGKEKLAAYKIALPPLTEQHEIVRRVDKLFAYADRLEARYQAAQARITQLTPSLLAKAFRGELVPQDPEDEPAEALLARIHSDVRKGDASRSATEPVGNSDTVSADASPLPSKRPPSSPRKAR